MDFQDLGFPESCLVVVGYASEEGAIVLISNNERFLATRSVLSGCFWGLSSLGACLVEAPSLGDRCRRLLALATNCESSDLSCE
jgi:hypothetical protein